MVVDQIFYQHWNIYLKIIPFKDGDKVYTSGKEGIFFPGIPIGEIRVDQSKLKVILFSDLSQITFVNINLERLLRDK